MLHVYIDQAKRIFFNPSHRFVLTKYFETLNTCRISQAELGFERFFTEFPISEVILSYLGNSNQTTTCIRLRKAIAVCNNN